MNPLFETIALRLEAARKELLDSSLRNPLLNFRLSKAQGVAVVQEESAQILDILVKQGKVMYFSALPEPKKKKTQSDEAPKQIVDAESDALPALEEYFEEHPPVELTAEEKQALLTDNKLQTNEPAARLETRLLNTYYTARTSLEETGVNILYLALGQLSWYESDSSAEPRHAPLLLLPVVLERGTVAERFKLTHSGAEVEGNLSLQARLLDDFGIELPLPDQEAQSLPEYFEAVEKAIEGRERWQVEPDTIVLGFFSFSKLMLYRDLDPANWPGTAEGASALVAHPAIGALLGTETGFRDAAPSVGETAFLDTESPAAELHQVLDADSSQLLALLAVQEGRNLVIQGPPGTGKSQTIANLLAEAIGAGQRVLFVAEKMAALEVVKRRLDALGLGAACLELHSNKANKKSLHEELRLTLALGRPTVAASLDTQVAQLPPLREQLNQYAQSVNTPLGRSHRTAQQVAGALLALQQEAGDQTLPRLPFANLANWTDADAARAEVLAARLEATLRKIGPPTQLLFWGTDLTVLLPADQTVLVQKLQAAQQAVQAVAQAGHALAALVLAPVPPDAAAVAALRPVAQQAQREAVAAHELSAPAAINALQAAAQRLSELLQVPIPTDQPSTEALLALAQHVHGEALVAHSATLAKALAEVQAAVAAAAALLLLPAPTDYPAALALLPMAEHAALAPPLPGVAVADAFWTQAHSPLPAARQAADALNALRQQHAANLLPEAWSQNLTAERAALVSTGDKFWRFLSGNYRRARRRLQQFWRTAVPSNNQELITAIDAVHEAARHSQTLQDAAPVLGRVFGTNWHSEASDWPVLLRINDYLGRTHQLIAQQRLPPDIIRYLATNAEASALTAPLAALTAALPRYQQALQEAIAACQTGRAHPQSLSPSVAAAPFATQATAVAEWTAHTPVAEGVAASVAACATALQKVVAVSEGIAEAPPAGSMFGLAAEWSRQAFAEQLETLQRWIANTPLPQAIATATQTAETTLAAQQHAIRVLGGALQLNEVRRFGKAGALAAQPFEEQTVTLDYWLADLPALQQAIEWNNVAAAVRAEGRAELLPLAETWPAAAQHLAHAVRQTWLEYLQRLAYEQFPALVQFERAGHEDVAAQFRAADQASLVHNRVRAMTRHFEEMPNPYAAAGGQMLVIKNEFARRRAHMPIRKLMLDAGHAVQAIKPVFMMSPLSVASFLPPNSVEFDLVVFDEASQVRPVDALGAIARGKQLVVVGDSKQLPPTSFFDSLTGAADADEENVTADIQSILELCKARLMPERMLRWHYRSLHQSLIAASNHLFYEDKLVIFPSPGGKGQLGLVYHHLPATHYERGTTRTNPQEAAAVAQAVLRHARTTPRLTLGVVAFSTSQRQAIQDALEILRRQHPETEAFFAAHRHEPFFIKNLENVQGDERDVILISVGYGRTKDGYLAMSFGPLNSEGGERRLNVLITRAKQRCEIFTNLTADDIDLSGSKHQKGGISALKTFLKFAQHGILNQNEETGREMDSPFEEEVHRALTARGYTVRPQIGSQGFFIDLAVVDPDQPGRYVLGIECDGAMYHSARSARDRDRLRQQVLEAVGWRLHRIWSTDWFRDPARETGRAVVAIEEARRLAALDEPDEAETELAHPSAPDDLEREEPTVPNPSDYTTTAYQAAKLPDTIRQQELHLHPVGLLARWVAEVVAVESPVHPDEVARRLGQAAGAAKVGRRMQASIDAAIHLAIKLQQVRQQGGFLWNVTAEAAPPQPRDRSSLPAASRKLSLVAPQELAQAALQIVQHSLAIEREAVASLAAKLFGFTRLVGEEPRLLFDAAIQQMLDNKALTDTNGVLRPA